MTKILVTKTLPIAIRKATDVFGCQQKIFHNPTASNPTGVSGIDTFVDDIIDIMDNSKDREHAQANLTKFLVQGRLEVMHL